MTALEIEDQRAFTEGLFIGDMFDDLLVREAEIITFNKFSIDGNIRHGFYSDEEMKENNMAEYSRWSALKPFCYSLIKGKRLPQSFRFVFMPDRAATESFASRYGNGIDPADVAGLYLNIQYEEHIMACITGTAVNVFTLDKSIDRAWDESVTQLFKSKGVAVSVEG